MRLEAIVYLQNNVKSCGRILMKIFGNGNNDGMKKI